MRCPTSLIGFSEGSRRRLHLDTGLAATLLDALGPAFAWPVPAG